MPTWKPAPVQVRYRNMQTITTDQLGSKLAIRFSYNREKVEADVDVEAKVLSAVQIAAERQLHNLIEMDPKNPSIIQTLYGAGYIQP